MSMKKCFSALLIIVLMIQKPTFFNLASDRVFESFGSFSVYLFDGELYGSRQAYRHMAVRRQVSDRSSESFDEYEIQYFLNGGVQSGANPLKYKQEDLPVTLYSPSREGYNFSGWYLDSSYTKKISRITQGQAGSYTLYAKWTKRIDGDYNIQMYPYQNQTAYRAVSKKLKNCAYSFLTQVKIPGMPSTREDDMRKNRITDTSQCPQGICMTEDYLLVSSHSGSGDSLGCLHVFERKTGVYLVTLGMTKESHLGGVAYDGTNVWVCNSDNNTLECIPSRFIKEMVQKRPQSVVDCSGEFKEYQVENPPSCIAYHDGKLWVATHTKIFTSKVTAYTIAENGLRQENSYRIPDKVQGIAFDNEGVVYLSASYGRTKSSYLKVYESADKMDQKPNQPMIKIEMPPCSEEIELCDGQIYILFESAGEKYLEGTDGKGKSVAPIDKVLAVSVNSVFAQH